MFKRNVTVSGSHQLSGKDGKKLRKELEDAFPVLDKHALKSVLPSKTEVLVSKMSNKCFVYSCLGQPIFFEHKGTLYPTVYTLWKFPRLLPALLTHSEVSPAIVARGADLMLPGVIVPQEGLGSFEEGDRMAIGIPENPQPFAVGCAQTGSEQIKETGLKGRGVKLLHHYPDALWAMGDKSAPNAGFKPSRIFPATEAEAGSDGAGEAVAADVEGLDISDEKPEACGEAKTAGASMDELVDSCFLRALHLRVKDADLPMDCGAFYSGCMLPCRPKGTEIDIKQSTYKKVSKLMKKMEKRGLVACKQTKKEDKLVKVNRDHEVYKLFERELEAEAEAEAGAAEAGAHGEGEAAAADATPSGKQIEVHECFRAVSNLRPVFGEECVRNKEMLFSRDECRAALVAYGRRENLVVEGKAGRMNLDKLLKSGLYGKKEGVEVGTEVDAPDVFERIMSKMQRYHRVVCDGAEVVKKGRIKNILVSAEDRHAGRKYVTKVTQLESFSIDPAEFGNTLQRKYKCSSTVQKLPGKNETGKEVSFQGNLLDEICAYLEHDCGIHPKFIERQSRMKR